MAYLSPDELLELWQSVHGQLRDEWKKQFLNKPQINLILQFTSELVIPAVHENQRLVDILGSLEAAEKEIIKRVSSIPRLSNSPDNEWRKPKKHLPSKRPLRTSQQAIGSKGIVPRFEEAHPSEYGSLTIKRPGNAEAILPGREKCPSCGMIVTGNNLKCRCG
jgi:hypothetical protein